MTGLNAASRTPAEVAGQPEIWQRLLADAPRTVRALPRPGAPVLCIGRGTSYYVGDSYARDVDRPQFLSRSVRLG